MLKCYIITLLIPEISKAVLMLHGEPNNAKAALPELTKIVNRPIFYTHVNM
jgi:hypothetical protein